MEIGSEKGKVMVNRNDSFRHSDTTLKDNKREEVKKFCYLGATLKTTYSCDFIHDTTIYYMEQPTYIC